MGPNFSFPITELALQFTLCADIARGDVFNIALFSFRIALTSVLYRDISLWASQRCVRFPRRMVIARLTGRQNHTSSLTYGFPVSQASILSTALLEVHNISQIISVIKLQRISNRKR